MRIRILSILSALLLIVAAACGSDDPKPSSASDTTTTTAAQMDDEADEPVNSEGDTGEDGMEDWILIEGGWARTSPSMATNGAAYMDITSPTDDRLIGARTNEVIAESIEIHETSMDEASGQMRMREVEGIDLPAGETVNLAPGGYHVMFLGLVAPFEVGDTLEVILIFENAGEVPVYLEIRDSSDMGSGSGGMGGMQHDDGEATMDDDH